MIKIQVVLYTCRTRYFCIPRHAGKLFVLDIRYMAFSNLVSGSILAILNSKYAVSRNLMLPISTILLKCTFNVQTFENYKVYFKQSRVCYSTPFADNFLSNCEGV